MPIEQRPAGLRPGARPAASKPQFRLRLPDVSVDSQPVETSHPVDPPEIAAAPRDPIAAARAKLSEKRFLDGHRQITNMIEKLRDKRRRLFRALWAASVGLTALSVIALAVEFVHRMDFLNSIGDTIQTDEPSESPRTGRGRAPRKSPRPLPREQAAAPRDRADSLRRGNRVEPVVYETSGRADQGGVWLPGTITDSDSDITTTGGLHDDHQSRSR